MNRILIHLPLTMILARYLNGYRSRRTMEEFDMLHIQLNFLTKFFFGLSISISLFWILRIVYCLYKNIEAGQFLAVFSMLIVCFLALLGLYTYLAKTLVGSTADLGVSIQLEELARSTPKTFEHLYAVARHHVYIRALDYFFACSISERKPKALAASYHEHNQARQGLSNLFR